MEENKNVNAESIQATPLSEEDLEAAAGGMELLAELQSVKTNCRAYCARCHRIHDLVDYGLVKIGRVNYRCYHCNDSHRQFAVSPSGEYYAWSTTNSKMVTKDKNVY